MKQCVWGKGREPVYGDERAPCLVAKGLIQSDGMLPAAPNSRARSWIRKNKKRDPTQSVLSNQAS